MSDHAEPTGQPATLCVPLTALVSLAIEYWRLGSAIDAPSAPVRHALRKIGEFLATNGLEVQSMDGRTFDPGLALRVVDTIEDASLPAGQAVIEETLSPMILYRGRVVKPAEVVTRQAKAQ